MKTDLEITAPDDVKPTLFLHLYVTGGYHR